MFVAPAPLVTVVALGAVGFGVALLFLVYSAPDLALTQLVVEVLTVVLFVFVLGRLPRPADPTRPGVGALALAATGGTIMATLTLLAFPAPVIEPISRYFDANSVPLAHGRNVVNVILVDFRALDTLGEITVLGVAALGVLALLRARRMPEAARARAAETGEEHERAGPLGGEEHERAGPLGGEEHERAGPLGGEEHERAGPLGGEEHERAGPLGEKAR